MPGALRPEVRRASRAMMTSGRSRFDSKRLLAKTGKARLRGEFELCLLRNLDAHIAQSESRDRARDPPDRLSLEEQFRARSYGVAVDLQNTQPPVDLASVALACDGLLAWIAALREADVRLVETGLCGKDAVVDLVSPTGDSRLDAPALEVILTQLL